MIPQSDIDRIEQAAKEVYPVEMEGGNRYVDLNKGDRDTVIELLKAEAAHWQPIVAELVDKNAAFELSNREKDATISTQAEAIRELVEGLEQALQAIDSEWYPFAEGKVISLINKHKKP